jgi:hypothetical protein
MGDRNNGKFYYEVDKFINFEDGYLIDECEKNKILPSVENRFTRIEWDYEIDNITFYQEKITTGNYEDLDNHCKVITKEEYYNSPQIKKQLLIKALKELK